MEKKPLLSLHDFIMATDKDFPSSFSQDDMRIMLIDKYKSIIRYAKFLDQPLEMEMFEGDRMIFEGIKYNDIQPSTNWNYWSISGYTIFMETNTNWIKMGRKVSDLTHLKLFYLTLPNV